MTRVPDALIAADAVTACTAAVAGKYAILRAMPEWDPDLAVEPPTWLVEGARVLHGTFGTGKVGRVGRYKDVPTVWIDFDDGQTKALVLEFGLPHLAAEADSPKRRGWFRRGRG